MLEPGQLEVEVLHKPLMIQMCALVSSVALDSHSFGRRQGPWDLGLAYAVLMTCVVGLVLSVGQVQFEAVVWLAIYLTCYRNHHRCQGM